MTDAPIIFQGNTQIYLQGLNALEVIEEPKNGRAIYLVGSPESGICIQDFRSIVNQAALKAIKGNNEVEFAAVFSNPAWVEIREANGNAEIHLHDSLCDPNTQLLWIGVSEEDEFPILPLQWDKFQLLEDRRIAFAALISG